MVLWGISPAMARGSKAPAVTAPRKMSVVARALEEASYFTETKARPNSRFYIFICSASWCAPCRALMPSVVAEYEKNVKQDTSVSMVLLGADKDADSARQYISHYNTDMPGVLRSDVRLENAPQIPGVPWYFILDSEGKLVSSGAGTRVLSWKKAVANARVPEMEAVSLPERKVQCKAWHNRNMSRSRKSLSMLRMVRDEQTALKALKGIRDIYEDAGAPKDECPDKELYEELYPIDNEQVHLCAIQLGQQMRRISRLAEKGKVKEATYDNLFVVCRDYTRFYAKDQLPERPIRRKKSAR